MKPLSDLIYESEAGLIEPETTPLGNGGILAEEGVGIAIDPNAKPNGRPGMNIGGTPCMLMSCQVDGDLPPSCGAAAPVIPLSAGSKCN